MYEFKTIMYYTKSIPKISNAYEIKLDKLSKTKKFISEFFIKYLHKWSVLEVHYDEIEIGEFRDTKIKKDKITDAVMSYLTKLQKEHYLKNRNDYCFLMGEKLFRELTHEQMNNGSFHSNGSMVYMSNDMYYNDPYRGKQVFNIPIHIVSHMDGILVVPKIIIEKRI